MPERESNQDRYCRNCGAEIRGDTSFCVSCGVPFTQVAGPSAPPPSEPPTSASFDSFVNAVREQFQGWRRRFSGSSSARATVQQISGRIINWFRDLETIPKLVIVGLVLLIPLALLSPVLRVAAIIALVASVVGLIVQAVQRKPVRVWGIAAVSSLVLVFAFGGISAAIYGGFFERDESSAGSSTPAATSENPNSDQSFASSGDWESTEAYIDDMVDSEEKVDSITSDAAKTVELAQDGDSGST